MSDQLSFDGLQKYEIRSFSIKDNWGIHSAWRYQVFKDGDAGLKFITKKGAMDYVELQILCDKIESGDRGTAAGGLPPKVETQRPSASQR